VKTKRKGKSAEEGRGSLKPSVKSDYVVSSVCLALTPCHVTDSKTLLQAPSISKKFTNPFNLYRQEHQEPRPSDAVSTR
jgi:hypothetical protein